MVCLHDAGGSGLARGEYLEPAGGHLWLLTSFVSAAFCDKRFHRERCDSALIALFFIP